jgi:hypothetical protein
MKTFAVLTVVSSWACLWFLPNGTLSRVLQLLVFGLLGVVFVLAGGFAYWWDAGMRPDQKSATILVCGLLTLLAQGGSLLQAALAGEGGTDWPRRRR